MPRQPLTDGDSSGAAKQGARSLFPPLEPGATFRGQSPGTHMLPTRTYSRVPMLRSRTQVRTRTRRESVTKRAPERVWMHVEAHIQAVSFGECLGMHQSRDQTGNAFSLPRPGPFGFPGKEPLGLVPCYPASCSLGCHRPAYIIWPA